MNFHSPKSEIRNPKSKVLIVDDEKSIRTTLSAFLRDEGYEVEVAEDVEHAQGLLEQEKYDVVVSDIILPRVTGVALLKQIKETAPDVQVIMMTGEPTVETAVEAVRAGACDYLTKPVGKPAILQSIATATKVRKLEDENRRYRENLEQLVRQRTSDLEQSVETLKKAQEQLIQQERMNAVGQMASGIAHDFNNVLMPIVGFSEMLLSDPTMLDDRKEIMHMLEMIRSAADDARHIVRRLRQIYKEDDSEYGPVDLAKVLESVVSITMPKWKEEMNAKGVTIEVGTECEDVPLIKGSTSEFREVLINLIFNAVDAMPDGGTITLRLKSKNGTGVLLEVSDTGIGMDETTSQRCIEPFFTTKGVQGSGLGLAMVYGVVERHGGALKIESKRGVGTTIQMRFPVPVATEDVDVVPAEKPERLSSLHVLVVDDEECSLNLIARLLGRDGHNVQKAGAGQEGLDFLRQGTFDLVFTDRAMPRMSGDEFAQEAQKIRSGIPVIMLTGFGDIMNDSAELPDGVSKVMSKPVTTDDLRYVMAKVMKQKQNGETKQGESDG